MAKKSLAYERNRGQLEAARRAGNEEAVAKILKHIDNQERMMGRLAAQPGMAGWDQSPFSSPIDAFNRVGGQIWDADYENFGRPPAGSALYDESTEEGMQAFRERFAHAMENRVGSSAAVKTPGPTGPPTSRTYGFGNSSPLDDPTLAELVRIRQNPIEVAHVQPSLSGGTPYYRSGNQPWAPGLATRPAMADPFPPEPLNGLSFEQALQDAGGGDNFGGQGDNFGGQGEGFFGAQGETMSDEEFDRLPPGKARQAEAMRRAVARRLDQAGGVENPKHVYAAPQYSDEYLERQSAAKEQVVRDARARGRARRARQGYDFEGERQERSDENKQQLFDARMAGGGGGGLGAMDMALLGDVPAADAARIGLQERALAQDAAQDMARFGLQERALAQTKAKDDQDRLDRLTEQDRAIVLLEYDAVKKAGGSEAQAVAAARRKLRTLDLGSGELTDADMEGADMEGADDIGTFDEQQLNAKLNAFYQEYVANDSYDRSWAPQYHGGEDAFVKGAVTSGTIDPADERAARAWYKQRFGKRPEWASDVSQALSRPEIAEIGGLFLSAGINPFGRVFSPPLKSLWDALTSPGY